MPRTELPPSAEFKLDLIFEGIRYTRALETAAEHSFPNFFPYRFAPGEHPEGRTRATIPYMFVTRDDMHARIKGNSRSPWWVSGSRVEGYSLRDDRSGSERSISFEPAHRWTAGTTSDGVPRLQAGVSLHGDMAVVNVAPGCDYFLASRQDGASMRCTFCTYGAPDARVEKLGQVMGKTDLPESTYLRMQEVLADALEEVTIRHVYLVGGSLEDPAQEGRRYIELARRVQEVNRRRIPVVCGSGALPQASLRELHNERLVDAVCFNLEIWSEPLFAKICPGKNRFVGYRRWIESLEQAAEIWGRGRVYAAMVAGIELGKDVGLSVDEALDTALRGAEDLCSRGVLPIYSLYWPPAGQDLSDDLSRLRDYYERLQLGYQEIRGKHDLEIWDGFMCHRCAYMQLECDVDRGDRALVRSGEGRAE